MDAEAIKRQAQDENSSPEILAELSKSKDKEILRLVAGNPNTTVEILKKLGTEFPDEIVDNPIFDLLLLENPESKFVLLSLARASTTSVEKLEELADYTDRDIREAVAINDKTPAHVVNNIFVKDRSIEESVAKNPRASEELLCSLANENKYNVLCAIARRKCLSARIIKILMQCDCRANKFYPNHRPENYSWRIRQELANNLDIRRYVVNDLIKYEHHHVRAAIAAREDISEEQAKILARDTSDYVRKKLANNPHISPAVTKLLNTVNENRHRQPLEAFEKSSAAISEFKRLLGLIYNPDTPSEILDRLATNANYSIRQGVAEHPRTKLQTLNKLKTDNNINVRKKIAANPNISLEMIEELSQDSMAIVRQAIANNPQTPMTILNRLTSDRSDCVRGAIALREDISESIAVALADDTSAYVRQRLVCNPNIPDKILELLSKDIDLISKDGNSLVQIAMIKNVDLSPKLFENLASSSSAKVRQEVAKHPKAPLSVLDRLKADRDKYVRVEVANNPNISSEIMEYLATDSINSKPTNQRWRNSSFRGLIDYHHQVRIAIAQRKDITEKAASILSKDPLPQVRWVLARNANVPLDIIISLCEDSNEKVRDEAIKMFIAR